MSKQSENSNSQTEHSEDTKCTACNDTGLIIEKKEQKQPNGKVVLKDLGRPCHCVQKRALKKAFKNSLIPDEFKNARFDNYETNSDAQETLFNAIKEYLKDFPEIIKGESEQNSLGFIAAFGETRIRSLQGEAKYQAKADHNNFGLGKTHLQMAAAKWILNRIRVRDDIEMNVKSNADFLDTKSKFDRGCQVLCVSDITFMDDLTSAKMAGDGGGTFKNLLHNAINVDVLVWDDLGKAKYSESKEGLYYQIINERYLHKRPIIFSSNEDKGTLSEKIGYAASSRLLGMCGDRLYAVEGEDYRMRGGVQL